MPPRQPPRPAPRPSKAPTRGAAKGGAARGGAKGAAQKGGAKTGGARKAAPAKQAPRGVRQPAGRAGANAEQLRQQRIMLDQQRRQREARWWGINQHALKDLHSRQHHSAGGEAIGTVLNGDRRMRWRTSHAVGAITLLILSFFFASMALGAQNIGIAVLAFLCLAGCIAFVTVERSARRFPQPVPAPPLIGQHRLEDLIVEDDAPRPAPAAKQAPATMDALDDLFEAPPRPDPAPTPAPAPPPVVAEPATVIVEVVDDEAAESVVPAADTVLSADSVASNGTVPPADTVPPVDIVDAQIVPEEDPEPPAPATASEGVRFSMPSDVIGGDPVAAAPPPPPPAKGPIAEAAAKLAPQPRRQTPEDARGLADLLLSEQRLDGTDVTDTAATLVVADLQRSVEFYTDTLGLHILDRTKEAAVLEAGFGKILLWERPDAPPGETGVMHLTFEVGDIDATFAEMNEAGVEFLHLPRTALLGQNYEMRAASFRDPDGHGLAITEHKERD
ncbi:VOC family protein [Glycomyces paridis]|uniref:VOC family protein n=1 Tax=Glycomyces paridis TaxID=2126555 RepID=A0A4S8PMZ2_9ACTN|nr:VOC family protein [Glycomyces paridis]THV32233.1 VOC family protein [Glycomyces paridis]